MRQHVSRMRRALAVIGAGALLVAASACGAPDDEDDGGGAGNTGGNGETVKIAFFGAQTGPDAQLGINISNAVELAVDEHNAKDGATQVELTKYDTQGDPTQASTQAQQVVQDGNVAIVGPAFSGESKTAVPIFEQGKIPNISASATAVTLAENGWQYWHRVLAADDIQGPGVADFMTNTLQAKSVAVIDDQSEYGKGLADAIRAQLQTNGTDVAVNDSIDPDASDYSTTVNQVESANVDVVYFAGYYSAAGVLAKQLADGGVDARFMSGDGSLDENFVEGAGDAADGSLLSCTCSWAVGSDVPEVQDFEKAYTDKFDTPPATYSSEGFDAANAILMAIDEGNTDAQGINDYLKTIDFKGISKPIKFESNGNLSDTSLFISEVVDGKITLLGDSKTAKPST